MSVLDLVALSGTAASVGNLVFILQVRKEMRGFFTPEPEEPFTAADLAPGYIVDTPTVRDRTDAITRPRQVGLSPRGQ